MSENSSVNRRVILGAMAGITASQSAAADHVGEAMARLTGALERSYGGVWAAHLDRANGFVLITETGRERPSV